MGLSNILNDQAVKTKVVDDCTLLIDRQVAAKSGLSGMALKAAYGMVKGIDATYVPNAIHRILPEVVNALEPVWADGLQAGNPVVHLSQNQAQTAEIILGITDRRIAKTNNGVVRSAYNKLRQSVKGDVEEAVPGLAKILDTHSPVHQ